MDSDRRSFLRSAAVAAPAVAFAHLPAKPVSAQEPVSDAVPVPELHPVAAGEDRFGKLHSLGFSELAFKVGGDEARGNLFIIEHRALKPGPPLHMHLEQEEWFYVVEGTIRFQVGEQRLTLGPGESILAPRRVPHSFASSVPSSQLLIAFAPAGKMEEYFRDAGGNGALAATPEFLNESGRIHLHTRISRGRDLELALVLLDLPQITKVSDAMRFGLKLEFIRRARCGALTVTHT